MTMLLISLALQAATASAMPPAPATEAPCPATPAALPAELAPWRAAQPMTAATTAETSGNALFTPGKAADLTLASTPDVKYAIRPENPGGSVSHGGIAAIEVARAGTYRVAIDSAAWIDVIAGGKSLESVGHGRGPACSGIRKMVDFRLEPGRYLLQLAGNGAPRMRVIVAAVPGA